MYELWICCQYAPRRIGAFAPSGYLTMRTDSVRWEASVQMVVIPALRRQWVVISKESKNSTAIVWSNKTCLFIYRQSSISGNVPHVKDGPQIPRDEHIQAFEKIVKYKFKDHSLIHEALQAAGCLTIGGNKGLALVGDSVLRLLIVLDGYAKNEIKGMNGRKAFHC